MYLEKKLITLLSFCLLTTCFICGMNTPKRAALSRNQKSEKSLSLPLSSMHYFRPSEQITHTATMATLTMPDHVNNEALARMESFLAAIARYEKGNWAAPEVYLVRCALKEIQSHELATIIEVIQCLNYPLLEQTLIELCAENYAVLKNNISCFSEQVQTAIIKEVLLHQLSKILIPNKDPFKKFTHEIKSPCALYYNMTLNIIVVATAGCMLTIYDTDFGRTLFRGLLNNDIADEDDPGHSEQDMHYKAIAFTPDNTFLIVGTKRSLLKYKFMPSEFGGPLQIQFQESLELENCTLLRAHPQKNSIIVCRAHELFELDLTRYQNKLLTYLPEHKKTIVDCAFSPDGSLFASADKMCIKLWDKMRCIRSFSTNANAPIRALAFNPLTNNLSVVVAGKSHFLYEFNSASGFLVGKSNGFTEFKHNCHCELRYSLDGKYISVACCHGRAFIFGANKNKQLDVQHVYAIVDGATSVAWSSENKFFAGQRDNIVQPSKLYAWLLSDKEPKVYDELLEAYRNPNREIAERYLGQVYKDESKNSKHVISELDSATESLALDKIAVISGKEKKLGYCVSAFISTLFMLLFLETVA